MNPRGASGHNSAGVLHLGAVYSFGDPANDRLRYRTQPEFFISETGGVDLVPVGVPASVPLFVDTGGIAANNFNLFGLEAGTAIGSWHVQSELLYMVVNQIGGPTVAFPGMYVQAGYFLTGETRPYNRQGGVFGRPERGHAGCAAEVDCPPASEASLRAFGSVTCFDRVWGSA